MDCNMLCDNISINHVCMINFIVNRLQLLLSFILNSNVTYLVTNYKLDGTTIPVVIDEVHSVTWNWAKSFTKAAQNLWRENIFASTAISKRLHSTIYVSLEQFCKLDCTNAKKLQTFNFCM